MKANKEDIFDIEDALLETLDSDLGTQIKVEYERYGRLTICTIAYIKNGIVYTKKGTARRRPTENSDEIKGKIISLIRTITSN